MLNLCSALFNMSELNRTEPDLGDGKKPSNPMNFLGFFRDSQLKRMR